jgi:thymidylate synthase
MNFFININIKMSINIIVNVTKYKGKLAIGSNNELLTKIPEDLKLFKSITTNNKNVLDKNVLDKNVLDKNVVVMGRKTWYSLPINNRPLKNRINIVITNNKELIKKNSIKFRYNFMYRFLKTSDITSDVYFFNMEQFNLFYKYLTPVVYVIGGSMIYNEFFKLYRPESVYLTESILNVNSITPDTFFEPLGKEYMLEKVSERKFYGRVEYRFLKYKLINNNFNEDEYLNLCQRVLSDGTRRDDRTETGTISKFGDRLEFDISDNVPLLTTKRVPWKSVIHELLWFTRGDTDATILSNNGVRIWDGNTSREFLDKRGLFHYPVGTLGPLYGWSMRFFGAKYSSAFSDTSNYDTSKIGGVDQIDYIIKEIKNNPTSRRILMSYWNPLDFDKMVLNPCHYSVQFYVNNDGRLDCLFNMRSSDVFLGLPFNIFSYTVLTYIIACKCDLRPGKLIYVGGDVHIYKNHIEQIREQLSRNVRSAPKLIINQDIKYKEFSEITIDDFEIVGYYPHPSINGVMAI